MTFQRAEKQQARLRLALLGPAGAGKTYTGLTLASHLGDRVAVIDTEHGSAAKYADLFAFDTAPLTDFSPESYIGLLGDAAGAGYDVVLIDSLTHEWKWCLEEVDRVKARNRNPNSFAAWKDITPRHDALTEAILASPCHVVATVRTKMEYVLEEDEKGKKTPRKVGMAPVQRDGLEYEFDLVADMDIENKLVVTKTRCPALAGEVIRKPGKELADTLKAWLGSGTPAGSPSLPALPNEDLVVILTGKLGELGVNHDDLIAANRHKRDWLERQIAAAQHNLDAKRDSGDSPLSGGDAEPSAGEDSAGTESTPESQFSIPEGAKH